jgi:hypothetical protein
MKDVSEKKIFFFVKSWEYFPFFAPRYILNPVRLQAERKEPLCFWPDSEPTKLLYHPKQKWPVKTTLKVHKHEIILDFFLPKSNPYMPFLNFWKKFRFFLMNFDVRTYPRWLSIRGTKFFWWAIQKIFFLKIFTLVLLDGFLDDFWKFWLFIVKIWILIWYFEYFSKIIACLCWAYAETILSHAEHMRNWFHRTLNIIGTNFRACSASGKMWTVFTSTIHAEHTRNEFYRTLSIRGSNFIAWWAYSEPISSHAEHVWKCLKVEYLGQIEYDFQKSRVTGPWDHMVSVSAKKVKKFHACVPLRGWCL